MALITLPHIQSDQDGSTPPKVKVTGRLAAGVMNDLGLHVLHLPLRLHVRAHAAEGHAQ